MSDEGWRSGLGRVSVRVDGKTWWRLSRIAERRGIRVDDLLAEIAATGGATTSQAPRLPLTVGQRVVLMRRDGLSIAEIAKRVGKNRQTVYYHLKRAGLWPDARTESHGKRDAA